MANYREISQQYAQGGIKASAALNGGAAIALLTQTAELLEKGYGRQVATSLEYWAIGVTLSAFTWIIAFISTRYVDRSTEADSDRSKEIRCSNRYMYLGVVLLLGSIVCFGVGACSLSSSLGTLQALPSSP